jgi:uncharacterized ion transporter superfamily protein YfcC
MWFSPAGLHLPSKVIRVMQIQVCVCVCVFFFVFFLFFLSAGRGFISLTVCIFRY